MIHPQDSSHVDIRGFMYFPFNFIRILMTIIDISERMVLINFLFILAVEGVMTVVFTKVLIHLLFTWTGATS